MERMLKLPLLHPWSVPRSRRKKYYGETSLATSRQIAGGGHTKRTDAQKDMCQTLCLVRFPTFLRTWCFDTRKPEFPSKQTRS